MKKVNSHGICHSGHLFPKKITTWKMKAQHFFKIRKDSDGEKVTLSNLYEVYGESPGLGYLFSSITKKGSRIIKLNPGDSSRDLIGMVK